jgi:hypothetical protein
MQEFVLEKHKHVPLGVLLTDLQKAFEYVHPIWIQQVLLARKAPLWLVKYAEYTLFGRSCRPKILGYKLDPIYLQVGVDMGSAISPLFFCLALDPVIRAVTSIHNVINMTGYMDDNATAIQDVTALIRTQQECEAYESAGLRVVKHCCCFFVPQDAQNENHQTTQGGTSIIHTARKALREYPTCQRFRFSTSECVLHRHNVAGLAFRTHTKNTCAYWPG